MSLRTWPFRNLKLLLFPYLLFLPSFEKLLNLRGIPLAGTLLIPFYSIQWFYVQQHALLSVHRSRATGRSMDNIYAGKWITIQNEKVSFRIQNLKCISSNQGCWSMFLPVNRFIKDVLGSFWNQWVIHTYTFRNELYWPNCRSL